MAGVTSDVDICNLALQQIKGELITSISIPDSSTEEACAMWYDQVRRECLRKLPWNFAISRAILARNATPPTYGYTDAYDLPNDYVRVLEINGKPYTDCDFEVENNQILIDNGGGALYIRYIFDQKNVVRFDALFVKLFYLELALRLAMNITGKQTFKNALAAEVALALTEAGAIDGQERPPRVVCKSRFVAARKYGAIGGNNTVYDM